MPLNVTPARAKEGRGEAARRGRKEGRNADSLKFTLTKKEKKSVEVTASSFASGLKGVLSSATCFIFDK